MACRENGRIEAFDYMGRGQGVVDLKTHGLVYAIAMRGDSLLALLWPRDEGDSTPQLAEVTMNPPEKMAINPHYKLVVSVETEALPGVVSPHDLVISGAEGGACNAETCMYVGETRPRDDASGSTIHVVRARTFMYLHCMRGSCGYSKLFSKF